MAVLEDIAAAVNNHALGVHMVAGESVQADQIICLQELHFNRFGFRCTMLHDGMLHDGMLLRVLDVGRDRGLGDLMRHGLNDMLNGMLHDIVLNDAVLCGVLHDGRNGLSGVLGSYNRMGSGHRTGNGLTLPQELHLGLHIFDEMPSLQQVFGSSAFRQTGPAAKRLCCGTIMWWAVGTAPC